jgi:hypothetical protein
MPSLAPVTRAQLPLGPKARSCKAESQWYVGKWVERGGWSFTGFPGKMNRLRNRRMKLVILEARNMSPMTAKAVIHFSMVDMVRIVPEPNVNSVTQACTNGKTSVQNFIAETLLRKPKIDLHV